MDDQVQGSVRRAAEVLDCHLIICMILINKHPHNTCFIMHFPDVLE